MDYGINEQEKWDRKGFKMCKHKFLEIAYKHYLNVNNPNKISFIDFVSSAESQAEILSSRSMRIKDESLFKPPATQPFRNDVIRAKVEEKTNNVPFN